MSTFPQSWKSTVSHWQATNRGPTSLWLHNSTRKLPKQADTVIIGAGMAGSALSYFLTREGAYGDGKRVVCLEAKDCGSGASGRNGGHIGPKTYHAWHLLMQPYPVGFSCSAEEAAKIMQNERDNLDLITEIVAREKLDVDFWRGELLETHHSKAQSERCEIQYAAWMKVREALGLRPNPETSFISDSVEAQRVSRLKGVTSVHVRPGGSVHSHKLCTELMRLAIDSTACDFEFYSWAPVDGFPQQTELGQWAVHTARGDVVANRVIFCTNAHTPNFFPENSLLKDHIQPYRGQCALITPPVTFSGAQSLRHTYNMKDGVYLVQTPMGGIVLGGGLSHLLRTKQVKVKDSYGAIDDSEAGVSSVQTQNLARFMRENFEDWGDEAMGEGLTRTWTGILSTVKDFVPLVGEVPGARGVSLVAGFAGHGMSRIFAVARGYADTLKTGQWDESLLPFSFELTEQRLERASKAQADFQAVHGRNVRVHGTELFEDEEGLTENELVGHLVSSQT